MSFFNVYSGKRVLVTGHTGFKGSWLSRWLLSLGAEVTGLALPPDSTPCLFDQLGLGGHLEHHLADIRDPAAVQRVVHSARPDFIFHLAAQPLVRRSYEYPVETYATNVLGTVHVLEAVRQAGRPCNVIAVTTDKCYENREWVHSYREEDPMGGFDPYSSSKGAAELVVSSYRRSYFSCADRGIRLASARAGNVIGGGDWAADRIVPDGIRALQSGRPVPVRNKVSTRPWQHVLEPLSGYLILGAALAGAGPFGGGAPRDGFCSGFNFGPALTSNRTVADLVTEMLRHWPGEWCDKSEDGAVHEAGRLNLAIDKAFHFLGWQPVWEFGETVARTVEWYRACSGASAEEPARMTAHQIDAYSRAAGARSLAWAGDS